MFYVVESYEQLELLQRYKLKDVYCEVIKGNDDYHPKLDSCLALYVRGFEQEKGYILPICHQEGFNLERKDLLKVLNSFNTLYVFDKKHFLYYFNHENIIDLHFISLLKTNEKVILAEREIFFERYYRSFPTKPDINNCIPLSKHYQRAEVNFLKAKKLYKEKEEAILTDYWSFLNDLTVDTFFDLEQNGIDIKEEEFILKFKIEYPELFIKDSKVYGSYNLYNITSRPTNSFNGFNFLAIPKDESRNLLYSKQGNLIELDYDGYHVRLVAFLVKYNKLLESKEKAHKQLAEIYFNKKTINEQEYSEAKKITFHAIYGKIPEEYKEVKFFKLIQEFIDQLWEKYQKEGKVIVPISCKEIKKEHYGKDMHKLKLFNYYIQAFETARNVHVLQSVRRKLEHMKSKIILYTYDSVIFDIHPKESHSKFVKVEEGMTTYGIYPLNRKYGKTLYNLV